MSRNAIDIRAGEQDIFIGESIPFDIDTKGSVSGRGLDSAPSAVGTATLTDPDGADAAGQLSGTSSLSSDTVTTPNVVPTSAGLYILLQPMTVGSGTLFARLKLLSSDATP